MNTWILQVQNICTFIYKQPPRLEKLSAHAAWNSGRCTFDRRLLMFTHLHGRTWLDDALDDTLVLELEHKLYPWSHKCAERMNVKLIEPQINRFGFASSCKHCFPYTGLQDFILICHPNAFFFSKITFSCVISPCDIQRPFQEHQCTWNINWSLCCCWHIPQNVPLQLQNGLKSPDKHTLHAQRCVTTLKHCF